MWLERYVPPPSPSPSTPTAASAVTPARKEGSGDSASVQCAVSGEQFCLERHVLQCSPIAVDFDALDAVMEKTA